MLLYMPYADNELVRKTSAGRTACFEVLMRRHTPALYRMGRAYGFDAADTEDLVMDAHLTAHQNLAEFDGRKTYRAWLSKIMVEKCRYRAELLGMATPTPASLDASYGEIPRSGPRDFDGNLDVENLPVDLRSAYVLREVEGFSDAETATLLHTSEAAVQSNVRTAKGSLRSSLRRRFFHSDVYPCRTDTCDRIVGGVLDRL